MPFLISLLDCQAKRPLLDDDFAIVDFDSFGAEVSGKPVFFSMQQNNSDDTCKVKAPQRNICYG